MSRSYRIFVAYYLLGNEKLHLEFMSLEAVSLRCGCNKYVRTSGSYFIANL